MPNPEALSGILVTILVGVIVLAGSAILAGVVLIRFYYSTRPPGDLERRVARLERQLDSLTRQRDGI
jgi:predicted membrane-bound mannosyltransferase